MLEKIENYFDLKYNFNKFVDKLAWEIAYKLIPHWLAYRVFVRVATFKEMNNPYETKCGVALERFCKF